MKTNLPRPILKASSLFVLLPVFVACGGKSAQNSETSGYVSKTDDRWRSKQISVCFTQDLDLLDNARGIIKKGLNEEYNGLGFEFTGFENCSDASANIEVVFTRGASSAVDEIGSAVSRVTLGIDHECSNAEGEDVDYLNSNCLRNVALHEFSHAVGLHHEMNRRDNDHQCNLDQTREQGESGALQIGDYDSKSVMNYCYLFQVNKKNLAVPLSTGDINTLKAIYEEPIAGVDRTPAAFLSSLSSIRFKVTGTGVTSFKIKFGRFDEIDCKKSSGYTGFLATSKTITGDALVSTFLEDNDSLTGDFRICLIGKSATKTQSYKNYTSIDVNVSE